MSKLKAFLAFTALVIVAMVTSVSAASATEVALPTILTLSGTGPVVVKAESTTGLTEFKGAVTITGKGYKFELTGEQMASLGTGVLTFKESKSSTLGLCESTGGGAGNVVVPVEFHLALELVKKEKLFVILILIKGGNFTFTCGTTKVTVLGGQGVDAEPFGVQTTSFTAIAKCNGSTPEPLEYDNDTGGMSSLKLTGDIAGISSASCLSVAGTITFTASADFEVMEP